MTNNFDQKRAYVNSEFARKTRGTSISNKAKTKLLKKLWKEAERKYN